MVEKLLSFKSTDFNKIDLMIFDKYLINFKYFHSFFSIGNRAYQKWYATDSEYVITNNCLVFKYKIRNITYFSFPLSLTNNIDQIKKTLKEINLYCLIKHIKLIYDQLPIQYLYILNDVYFLKSQTTCDRWRLEYLYDVNEFINLIGSKYQRIRNLIKKFIKQNLNYELVEINNSNYSEVEFLLNKFWNKENIDEFEKKLNQNAETDILHLYKETKFFNGLCLKIDNKIEAFCITEKINETLLIHIEKVNHNFKGLGAFFLHKYVEYYTKKFNIKYFNRIDDAGSIGLRRSKLQYHPKSLIKSYRFIPSTNFYLIDRKKQIICNELILKDIDAIDKQIYYQLNIDNDVKNFYGYNYLDEFKQNNHGLTELNADWFMMERSLCFKHQEEATWGIYLNNQLIGEVSLYEFTYDYQCSIGYRLLPQYRNKGYAINAAKALIKYAFEELGIERINCKCYIENLKSKKLIEKIGMKYLGSDNTYYFYYLLPEMNF